MFVYFRFVSRSLSVLSRNRVYVQVVMSPTTKGVQDFFTALPHVFETEGLQGANTLA